MKKAITTFAILVGLTLGGYAQGGGLFQKGAEPEYSNRDAGPNNPMMPIGHGFTSDVNSQNGEPTGPLGSGVAVLLGLGAAYVVAKKRREE